jgi:hypothetical protein
MYDFDCINNDYILSIRGINRKHYFMFSLQIDQPKNKLFISPMDGLHARTGEYITLIQ